ncbi:hypothetical protein [Ghiorsea bivora]|uniref:hypothetical protein n=1 Tax=Ghiorsea bivora TaxID=1485545 RepID=UPI00068ADBA4|nr:hypothetical protein [Ghiorsea bivora]
MGHQQLQALFSNLDDLRALVGRKVRYLNDDYEITDLLADEDMLVLSSRSDDVVQDDCYGRAHRMVPKQQRLRFRDPDGKPTAIWDEIIFLDGAL